MWKYRSTNTVATTAPSVPVWKLLSKLAFRGLRTAFVCLSNTVQTLKRVLYRGTKVCVAPYFFQIRPRSLRSAKFFPNLPPQVCRAPYFSQIRSRRLRSAIFFQNPSLLVCRVPDFFKMTSRDIFCPQNVKIAPSSPS